MTEKSKLAALVLLAERANLYGSLETKYPNDAKEVIEAINLKQKLEKLSDANNTILKSSNYSTYGL